MPGAPWLVWAGLQKPCREQTSHAQEQDSYWAYPGTPLFRPPEFLDWFIMFYLSQHPPQHSTSTSTRKPLVWPYGPYDLHVTARRSQRDLASVLPSVITKMASAFLNLKASTAMEAWWRHDGAGERPRPNEIPVGVWTGQVVDETYEHQWSIVHFLRLLAVRVYLPT